MRFRLLSIVALLATVTSCEPTAPKGPSDPAADTYAASLGIDIPTMVKVNQDLYYKDVVVGNGTPAATIGKTITINYTGYLPDGTIFDSNGTAAGYTDVLDDNHFIAGWVLGIAAGGGMKPGGTRKLAIGSALAYGAPGSGKIPGNSTIVFEVILKSVK